MIYRKNTRLHNPHGIDIYKPPSNYNNSLLTHDKGLRPGQDKVLGNGGNDSFLDTLPVSARPRQIRSQICVNVANKCKADRISIWLSTRNPRRHPPICHVPSLLAGFATPLDLIDKSPPGTCNNELHISEITRDYKMVDSLKPALTYRKHAAGRLFCT